MTEGGLPLHRMDTFRWEGEGYQPCVSHRGWLVALMNWEARFDAPNAGPVERHNDTDEVFVLTRGQSVLFIATDAGLQAVDMEPGVIYNVTRGTWHGVLGTRDAGWLIVEASDTSAENSDYRQLDEPELAALRTQWPAWLKA